MGISLSIQPFSHIKSLELRFFLTIILRSLFLCTAPLNFPWLRRPMTFCVLKSCLAYEMVSVCQSANSCFYKPLLKKDWKVRDLRGES